MTTGRPLYIEPRQIGAIPPTDHENMLGDALEAAFADGIHELEPLVARLNERGVPAPDGGRWTAQSFATELRRLGDLAP